MITKLQEITDWGDAKVTNGIYHVNAAGHLVGYETPKHGYRKFSKPMKGFNKSGRKFEKVGEYPDPKDDTNSITIEGSKGNVYTITEEAGVLNCTCPGFTYRGHCKHVEQIEAESAKGSAPAWQ